MGKLIKDKAQNLVTARAVWDDSRAMYATNGRHIVSAEDVTEI